MGDLLAAGSLSSDQHIRDALAELDVDAGDRRKLEAVFIAGKTPSRQRLSDNTETQIARALVNAFLALALWLFVRYTQGADQGARGRV